MLFRPRRAPTLIERLRVAMWPRRSWRRSFRYHRARLMRAQASPHAVGLGLAAGVFVAFLPVFGIQMLLAGLIAWMGRASVLAALVGTFAGNPLTWPLMWIGSYSLGASLLGEPLPLAAEELRLVAGRLAGPWPAELTLTTLLTASELTLWPVLKPLLLGSLVLGLVCALTFYCMVRRAAEVSQTRRSLRCLATRHLGPPQTRVSGSPQ